MNTATKITAFAAAIGATFGTAYAVGGAVGPEEGARAAAESGEESAGHGGHESGAPEEKESAAEPPGGLQISQDGYTLDLERSRLKAGEKTELSFTVEDGSGRKVTAYDREHGKDLHLIIASRDLGTYRHLHPTRAADGTWSTPVDLPKAGGYRVFADFTPKGGEGLTLGADLAVAGRYDPAALPEQSAKAKLADGYEVTLDGPLTPGRAGELKLRVSKDGKPVTDLEPYLEAYGHLVALRSGDLAYLHVHPNEGGPGPVVSFTATAPSEGSYRLFLDFKHDGKVRTAEFTVRTSGAGAGAADEWGDDHGAESGHTH
ncbi:DUF748 domain-containing protein [Streptomyces boluensis]|uniref:DUF748 domain-containing protein n=1 Tax=Streptomyces boluensis TaxID=1775135 RepID=A0A964USC8_9ACTN|nr:DUF748 domain-containing protein [Streptomyces boluensis]NBE54469.1 hypothetical protein [Streptomyces boluensis]